MRSGSIATVAPLKGSLIAVDLHKMHLYCTGHGEPVVILEAPQTTPLIARSSWCAASVCAGGSFCRRLPGASFCRSIPGQSRWCCARRFFTSRCRAAGRAQESGPGNQEMEARPAPDAPVWDAAARVAPGVSSTRCLLPRCMGRTPVSPGENELLDGAAAGRRGLDAKRRSGAKKWRSGSKAAAAWRAVWVDGLQAQLALFRREAEFGAMAIWNVREIEHPSPERLWVITRSPRVEGDFAGAEPGGRKRAGQSCRLDFLPCLSAAGNRSIRLRFSETIYQLIPKRGA